MDSSSRRMLPELNLAKLYSNHNRENVRFTTGGSSMVPPSSSYRGRRFISATRHEAQAMLRPALYTGMHSTFWDTLASTRRMSRGSNEGGPHPVPLSERTHDRTRGSNKSMGHTLGSVTERPQKNNAESMLPSLPSLGPREGGVLITALDAKAMKLHPASSRRRRGEMRRHYSRRPSNGSNNVPGVNPSSANIVIPTVVEGLKSESRAQHPSAARLCSRQGDRGSALALAQASVPLTPADILSIKGHTLTPFEVGEITGFPHIYYVGQRRGHDSAQQPAIVGQEGAEPLVNDGFDDARGDYHVVKHDHMAYRYEILGSLGKGSFGQVWRCLDHQTSTQVALKIVRNKKRFRAQGEIEVKILQHVRDNDPDDDRNVIHFIESFYFRNHLCIAFPLMSLNLYDYLKDRHFRGLSLVEINYMARQLLSCLSFLKQQNIVHCDLKPENVLLREEARLAVVLIDFGSSCFKDHTLYTYIQSRFYRSPEVLLGLPYGQPIDMWSVGCILAELYTGVPLFPGENEVDQMSCITEVMGALPVSMVRDAPKRKRYFGDDGNPTPPQNTKNVTRRVGSSSLGSALRCEDAGFVSFLSSTLALDPAVRADADTAAAHEWMTLHPHRPQSKAARSRLGSPSLRASLRRHMHDLAQTQPLASTGPHTAPHSGPHIGPAYTTQPPPQTAPTVGPLTSNPSAGGLKPDAQGQRKIRNSLQTLESLPLTTVTEGVVAAPPPYTTRESSTHHMGTHTRRPSHHRESQHEPPPEHHHHHPHAPPARPTAHNGQQPFHHHYHHRQRSSGHMPNVAPPPM